MEKSSKRGKGKGRKEKREREEKKERREGKRERPQKELFVVIRRNTRGKSIGWNPIGPFCPDFGFLKQKKKLKTPK